MAQHFLFLPKDQFQCSAVLAFCNFLGWVKRIPRHAHEAQCHLSLRFPLISGPGKPLNRHPIVWVDARSSRIHPAPNSLGIRIAPLSSRLEPLLHDSRILAFSIFRTVQRRVRRANGWRMMKPRTNTPERIPARRISAACLQFPRCRSRFQPAGTPPATKVAWPWWRRSLGSDSGASS